MRYNEGIREIREDSSLKQQKIADLLHIGQRTYADYEIGSCVFIFKMLLPVIQGFNLLSASEFLPTEK